MPLVAFHDPFDFAIESFDEIMFSGIFTAA
jgi:hypothetical protein